MSEIYTDDNFNNIVENNDNKIINEEIKENKNEKDDKGEDNFFKRLNSNVASRNALPPTKNSLHENNKKYNTGTYTKLQIPSNFNNENVNKIENNNI